MAQTKNIDIIPNNAIKRVHVSQGDIGRTIYFNLYEGSLAYTPTSGDIITCVGTKPSGLGFTVTCTWSGNVVTCVTTEAMTDESGSIDSELVITSSDETTVLGTSNFVLVVEKNPHPDTTTDGRMETLIPELTLLVNEVKGYAEEIEDTYHAYGSPWVASTVSAMTDTSKIYVYTGSESGYTSGNWYYYNGTAWVSGGVYNSVAVQTDTTLSVSGMAADAEAVGDEITNITGVRKASFTKGYNMPLGNYSIGDVVNLTPETKATWSYSVETCSYGEYVLLNCKGGTNPRAYAFLDAENKLISVSNVEATCVDLALSVPSGASKIVINSLNSNLGDCWINALLPKVNAFDSEIENLELTDFIYIRGVGTKSSGNTGVTGARQYFVHENERKLKFVTSYTNSTTFTDVTMSFKSGCVYWYDSGLYKYSGASDFDGLELISTPFDYSTKTYYIRGVGTKAQGDSGVTGIGQFYVHYEERKLKYILTYSSPTSFTDLTLDFSTDALYVFDGELYKYSGSDDFDGLVKISVEYTPVREQTLDSYVSQIMNVLDYIGENHFYERNLTLAEANAYVSWPIISYVDSELICVYARGTSHTDSYSGAYYKTSPNGIIWSSEKTLLDTALNRENATGKGYDVDGDALFWIRHGNYFTLYKYDSDGFTAISSDITVGSFAHFGDIINIANDKLLCFWNDYATNRSYGIATSEDSGVTWTVTTFDAEESNSEVPTETQGAYLGDNKILAIGRKDVSGGTYAQMQFQSSDNGATWTKAYTNITDISASTTSVVYDDATEEIYLYYYNRANGNLLMRHAQISDVWDNPTNWSDAEVILTGGTGQDAGNVNVVPMNGKHYITYYSGNSSKTGVFTYINTIT